MAAILVEGIASTFTLPNYQGPLFQLDPMENVFSGMVGNVAEGQGRVEENYEFGVNVEDMPEPEQPAILEGDTPVDPVEIGMAHRKNVTQIFEESYGMTYSRTASLGRIDAASTHTAGGTSGAMSADPNPWERQAMRALGRIRRNLNYTFINGTYNNPANPTTEARKTRGMLAAIVEHGHVVSAANEQLTKDVLDELLRTMWAAGSLRGQNMVQIFCNAYQKQRISNIYGYAPDDRNVGGVNIKQIETDFGVLGITLERDMPTTKIMVANLSVVTPVYNLVRGRDGEIKGVLFTEPVPTGKNSYQDHIYGEIGLDHGPGEFHGLITDLADAPPVE